MRLQPRVQPFEKAVEAYRLGRIGDCIDQLRGNSTQAGRSLSARALLRVAQPQAALTHLSPIDDDLTHADRAQAHMLRGSALVRLSRFEEAERAYDTARVFTLASASAAVQAEFDQNLALRSFIVGDNDAAEASAYRVLTLEPYSFESDAKYFVPLNHSRSRAFELLGFLEARRERYGEQSAFLCRALGEHDCEQTLDVWHELQLLQSLSGLVRDLALEAESRILRERLAREWPVDGVAFRFNVLRALGMSSALQGDHVGALRDLRSAAEFAPAPAMRLAATLDRALLARELHQAIMAREELDYAERLSAQIDWSKAPGEDRHVLLLLAEVLTYRTPEKGRRAMERYRGIKTALAPDLLGISDRRWQADEAFAEGVVLRAEGQNDRACVYFGKAFEIWDAIGYSWRAARAALELAEVRGDARFAEYARREAEARPNSWLAYRVSKLSRWDRSNES